MIPSGNFAVILNESDLSDFYSGLMPRVLGGNFCVFTRESLNFENIDTNFECFILMGSDWFVSRIAENSQAMVELALVKSLIKSQTPVLGICYGAQLLALASGGSIHRLDEVEIGWHKVYSNGAGMLDRSWFQWHLEGFTKPPGSVMLGWNSTGSQIFQVGTSLGVQFHPEITPTVLANWGKLIDSTPQKNVAVYSESCRFPQDVDLEEHEFYAIGFIKWCITQVLVASMSVS